ncbi:MAG: ubiquinone/menaquinone biosynthesis methyltransferase [Thermoplasmata archaeon]|nr:ubiquinone/menaquinone biosynthesis methyltransferase [Thermoplasmata archaeon]
MAGSIPRADRTASDGSPYPDRNRPTFERDVRAMFTHIAVRYDWFDHVASLGNDYLWRPRALWDLERRRSDRPTRRILDIGCGTGDLTRQAARRFPSARVVGADFTPAMLQRATELTGDGHRPGQVDFAGASALHLPFRSASFDVVMSAFVARNLPSLPLAFRELRRVLTPGGTLLTLEITEPPSALIGSMFHAYFDRVVPWLGAAVKSAGPYRYLPESLRHLPATPRMLELLREAGYDQAVASRQSFGIVTSFFAEVAR